MKKSGIVVFGFLIVLMLVVFASGCINNETLLYQYNLTAGEGPDLVGVQNVTIPNGTSTVKFVGQDLTRLNPNINASNVNILILNTIPVSGATGENYTVNILEQKTINLANETQPLNVTYTFNNTNIKGLLITNTNAKGLIQIYTS
ncbi:hypothetical protein [Methanobacterium sp. ACI-7]|uniref:hypothetical protein n=1 Tax=unclassified Methanobacterium TaxID=2627676 RepID=UPI0039C2F9F6